MALSVIASLVGSLIVVPAYSQQTGAPQASQAPPAQPGGSMSGSGAAAGSSRALTLAPDYSFGQSYFPHFTLPYRPLTLPEPPLTNSPRIDQLIVHDPKQGDKLMLSLEDAISLGLENNMDIAVQRFTPWLDETALLRAKSGVNGRLVFDPVLTGTAYISQSSVPVNNPFLAGVTSASNSSSTSSVAPNLISHNGVANFNYTQGFATRHATAGQFRQHALVHQFSRRSLQSVRANLADGSGNAASA